MFIYFDLGNVILNFSHERMCRQIAEVTGTDAKTVHHVVFDSGLKEKAEAGGCSCTDFLGALASELKCQPNPKKLERAISDIFTVNTSLIPLLGHLRGAGHRIGLLSNICESHWKYICQDNFGCVPELFSVLSLSYEIGCVKPDPRIFTTAAAKAGVPPQEIFYTDDIPGHVAAAKAAGFDAVQFTTVPRLHAELRKRGIRCNY